MQKLFVLTFAAILATSYAVKGTTEWTRFIDVQADHLRDWAPLGFHCYASTECGVKNHTDSWLLKDPHCGRSTCWIDAYAAQDETIPGAEELLKRLRARHPFGIPVAIEVIEQCAPVTTKGCTVKAGNLKAGFPNCCPKVDCGTEAISYEYDRPGDDVPPAPLPPPSLLVPGPHQRQGFGFAQQAVPFIDFPRNNFAPQFERPGVQNNDQNLEQPN